MDKVVTLLSIFLTPALLIASSVVIYLLYPSFKKATKTVNKDAIQWMIIGIVMNFIGTLFDNLWWFFAWSYNYIDATGVEKDFFFSYGVYSNTIFRQVFGIVGALCHVYAGTIQASIVNKIILYLGAVIGTIQVIILLLIAK